MLWTQDAKFQFGPAQLQGDQLNLSPASTGIHAVFLAVSEK